MACNKQKIKNSEAKEIQVGIGDRQTQKLHKENNTRTLLHTSR